MIFEWYSGSDRSLSVANKLAQLDRDFDNLSDEERLSDYQALLAQERDPNWQASILHTIGWVHRLAERWDASLEAFKLACRTYDPFAANFDDVEDDYCRSHYFVAAEMFTEAPAGDCLQYALKAVPYLNKGYLDGFERSMILSCIGASLNDLGDQPGHSWAHVAALGFHLAAHHLEPEDPGTLERLYHAYDTLGDRDAAARVLDAFLAVGDEYLHRERLVAHAMERGYQIPIPQ